MLEIGNIIFAFSALFTICQLAIQSPLENCEREENFPKTLERSVLVNYLSTKTPYNYESAKEHESHVPLPYPDCKAQKLWYFGRHGSRSPTKKSLKKMQDLLPKLQQLILSSSCNGLSQKQLKQFEDWDVPMFPSASSEPILTPRGKQELRGIGERYRKKFPSLFEKISIHSTNSIRTKESADAFVLGALGHNFERNGSFPEYFTEDQKKVIKFYDDCTKWKEQIDDNINSTPELRMFEISTEMNETLSKVSTMLGLVKLSLEELTLMYTACAYETEWGESSNSSAWCAPFDENDLKVMAYREDLEYYWKDGYGYELNFQQSCPTFTQLSAFLRNDFLEVKTQAFFSHSGAIQKLLARLGLFRDLVPLRSELFSQIKNNYKWRTSVIGTMASNIAFISYNCPSQDENAVVGFLFQEKVTSLPDCDSNWFCSQKEFLKKLNDRMGPCNFEEICSLDRNNKTGN